MPAPAGHHSHKLKWRISMQYYNPLQQLVTTIETVHPLPLTGEHLLLIVNLQTPPFAHMQLLCLEPDTVAD
jgi:hypothetical protein